MLKVELAPFGEQISPPQKDADLFEIATHLELEALALAWAIRNRQIHHEKLAARQCNNVDARAPFGLPDPTGGATHFHRHDESPSWSTTSTPTALISGYLFYDLRKGSR